MSITSPNEPFDLEAMDRENREKLKPALADHCWVLDRSQCTIATVLQLALDKSPNGYAKVFCINLLTRLQNELMAVKLLCQSGYSLQAFAIGSVIYELVWAIAGLGIDNDEAGEWFSHTKDSMFKDVFELTRRGLLNLRGKKPNQSEIEEEYLVYKQLCLGKHFNPKLQQTQGFDLSTEPVSKMELQEFSAGSAFTQREVIKSWWLIERCLHLLPNALRTFMQLHVPAGKQARASEEIVALEKEVAKLVEDAARVLAQREANEGRCR